MSKAKPLNPNLLVQERFVAAVFAGDTETIHSLCHSDFELCEGSGLPFAGIYHGSDGFLAFLGVFNETLDIERLEPRRSYVTTDPDFIACEFDLRATIRASGEVFESTLVEIWGFRDGRVLSLRPHYFNAIR